MSGDPFQSWTGGQLRLLNAYQAMLLDFNRRVNLVSRGADAEAIRMHCRHALFLTHRRFPPGAVVIDWGTGGGLPAVPLAIACPDIRVVAVDKVEKKAQALRAIIRRLGLANATVWRGAAEVFPADEPARYASDYVYSVSRATAPLRDVWAWHRRVARPCARPPDAGAWRPGALCLKGGDLADEIASVATEADVERIDLADMDPRAWFRDKAILACTPRSR